MRQNRVRWVEAVLESEHRLSFSIEKLVRLEMGVFGCVWWRRAAVMLQCLISLNRPTICHFDTIP